MLGGRLAALRTAVRPRPGKCILSMISSSIRALCYRMHHDDGQGIQEKD
jgi:hypothetical protein